MIRLTLPYPVSANRYWRQFLNPRTRHVMQGPSAEAQSYKREVASIARQAGIRTPLAGRVQVRFWLVPHAPSDAQKRARLDPGAWDLGVQCLDLDNAQKVLMDSLKGVVFEDDRLVHRIEAERAEPGKKGLIVEIEPFTPSWLRDKPTPLNG